MNIVYFLLLMFGLYIFGFNSNNPRENYDKGYEAAWNGDAAPRSWPSKNEQEGYEAGLNDVWMYDSGYDDGYDHKRPKYYNDPFYMDGYKDGKKDKKRGL